MHNTNVTTPAGTWAEAQMRYLRSDKRQNFLDDFTPCRCLRLLVGPSSQYTVRADVWKVVNVANPFRAALRLLQCLRTLLSLHVVQARFLEHLSIKQASFEVVATRMAVVCNEKVLASAALVLVLSENCDRMCMECHRSEGWWPPRRGSRLC